MTSSYLNIAVVMDDIAGIKVAKDSTLAMMLSAQDRGHRLFVLDACDLFVENNQVFGTMCEVSVFNDAQKWFEKADAQIQPLSAMDVVLMRKDPPFNMDYIYATYLLEQAQQQGAYVINAPRALRDFNEKLAILSFPQCTAPTLVSASNQQIQTFIKQQQKVVVKPLDGMGGSGIFLLEVNDVNQTAIIKQLTRNGERLIMVQAFLPEIAQGDKRILLIDGTPVPYALARVPQSGGFLGNLAAGGKGVGVELNERDYWLCEQVAPTLRENGLLFVGLDVIGDCITEINVTSPTCIRELDTIYKLDIAGQLLDVIEAKNAQR